MSRLDPTLRTRTSSLFVPLTSTFTSTVASLRVLSRCSILQLVIVIGLIASSSANSDGQCCRKRIQCYECDSRYEPRCGEPFNLTQSSGLVIGCDDLCVKLKHKFNGNFFYIRSCADQFKRIHIKKTDVCYSTRLKDGGNLCFCDQEFCNHATRARKCFTLTSVLVLASLVASCTIFPTLYAFFYWVI